MCGIIGYVGKKDIPAVLLEGLRRLEYRGYDSCGIAVLDNGCPKVARSTGRVASLEPKMLGQLACAPGLHCGIGHTRWATHGRPSETNAHPHRDCSGHILVAHNGIIENHHELRRELMLEGHRFESDTDTEVLPHLIESHFRGDLAAAVRAALRRVEGAYGMVAISTHDGAKIIAARRGPPLVIGFGSGESFVASDTAALLTHTRDVIFLEDGDIAEVSSTSVTIRDLGGRRRRRRAQSIPWAREAAERDGYPHFMLKEIHEQPKAIRETLRGRVTAAGAIALGSEFREKEALRTARRILILGCGTSLHAGLIGRAFIETCAGVPVDVDYASEFRYRGAILDPGTVAVAITQSGETADTLAAIGEARRRGASTLAVCNVVGSSAAREADNVLYTRAGPEIGVASTKAFTTQIAALLLLALHLAHERASLPAAEISDRLNRLCQIPGLMERVLEGSGHIAGVAERLARYRNLLYLGRGLSYPIAMEGALKLKEISYLHAEGYPAGEMKHGPIALVDQELAAVAVVPRDAVHRKTLANIEEIKGRDGHLLVVATEGDMEVAERADELVFVPETDPLLTPLLTVVPLQLLAYHAALLRGCDVDKPRNLAKSVTVE